VNAVRLHTHLVPLMQQGLQARREGRMDAARAAFERVLQEQPEQPDALTLLAEVLQGQGAWPDASNLVERALRSDPQHLAAWSRKASLLAAAGQPQAAEAAWAQVCALKPDYAEAFYNRARMLQALGRQQEARSSLQQAMSLPTAPAGLQPAMLQLLALLQEQAQQLPEALQTLDRALQLAPQRAALHHNRGVLLQRLNRPAQALAAHDTAMALGLDAADAHYNRGNSLQSLGRSAHALQAYRAALDRDPQHALALYDTARLRWRMGQADFCAELDAAIAAAPASALGLGIKGRLLLRAERFAAAADAFAQAASRAPATPGYHDGLGQALARLQRFDEALAAHQRAVALAPQDAGAHVSWAACLLQAGQAAHAVQAAEQAVQLAPHNQEAWAMAGLAWRAAGDPRERWLNDFERHVQVFDLEPPAGWADMASFNDALAQALQAQHLDAEAPVDQTLRHGTQTLGDIFEQGLPLVMQLKQRVSQAVDSYVAGLSGLPADPSHPLRGRAGHGWRFSDSWSSRLRSSGFHTQHVHPHGWISSCYYVALPGVVRAGQRDQAGWITFGVPDIRIPGLDPAPQRTEQPRAGRLVLFPSFMWHGTVPFDDAGDRLTVAFDVLPLA
jgi:tetratricopeptide (TPR) repeat protein